MSSSKQLKTEQKRAVQQQQLLVNFNALVADIDRCEKSITDLKTELEQVNVRHQNRRSTREDIAYLEDLLKCAKKKLAWEKNMSSLQKRTPEVLAEASMLINDPVAPPSDEVRNKMLEGLVSIRSAMERLQGAKVE